MSVAAIAADFRHPRPRPRPGAPPPRVLAITIARYREQFERRRGPLWEYLRARTPAMFEADGSPGERSRALRTDGADSLLCVIVTLLSCMDIRRGFLARPPAEPGQRWHRRSVRELFGFAFGDEVPGMLSQRRIERHLRSLAAMGVLKTYQVRRKTARGFESQTAIRHMTDHLFRLAGTLGQLAKERREAWQRAAAERRAHRVESIRMDQREATPLGAPGVMTGNRSTVTAGRQPRAGPSPAADLLGRIIAPLRR